MKKVETNILLIILLIISMGIFCGCERKNRDVEEPCKFEFPVNESIDATVYAEMKKTCEKYWDLCQMIDSTVTFYYDSPECTISCYGYDENKDYSKFLIRFDNEGHWMDNGTHKCNFNFPAIENIDATVYAEMKKTCERYWDLCLMIDSTFSVHIDLPLPEYAIHCYGYGEDNRYSLFWIRVDKDGKWINDGR
jgi:hypothetical protein